MYVGKLETIIVNLIDMGDSLDFNGYTLRRPISKVVERSNDVLYFTFGLKKGSRKKKTVQS